MHTAFGLTIPTTLEDLCHPERMALLVYDMQVGIAGRLPNAQSVISNARNALESARLSGMRVFFCRHMTLPNEVAGVSQLKASMQLQRVSDPTLVKPNFLRESPGFPIIPELEPRATEAVFDKLAMSAFVGSLLEYAFRDARIEAFAVVGAVLNIGIEPTVRHGVDLGFSAVLLEDACYSFNAESHARSLEQMSRVATVTNTRQFASTLESKSKPVG